MFDTLNFSFSSFSISVKNTGISTLGSTCRRRGHPSCDNAATVPPEIRRVEHGANALSFPVPPKQTCHRHTPRVLVFSPDTRSFSPPSQTVTAVGHTGLLCCLSPASTRPKTPTYMITPEPLGFSKAMQKEVTVCAACVFFFFFIKV